MAVALDLFSVLLLGALGALIWFTLAQEHKNSQFHTEMISVPFTGYAGSGSAPPLTKRSSTGSTVDQISCPPGYAINIVTAAFDVYDPYQQCNPAGSLDSLATSCKDNPDPNVNPPCGNTYSAMGSAPPASATGANKEYLNTVCLYNTGGGGGSGACKMRDASAYLAAQCDGRSSCSVNIDPTFFGPYPCDLTPSSDSASDYTKLPRVSSSQTAPPGKNPAGSVSGVKQGYIVSGLFTCIPSSKS